MALGYIPGVMECTILLNATHGKIGRQNQVSENYVLEHTGHVLVGVHKKGTCINERCTVHNKSGHSMRSFPQLWRTDRGVMERVCPHGVGHPDPDEVYRYIDDFVHGCDGCCEGAYDEIQ